MVLIDIDLLSGVDEFTDGITNEETLVDLPETPPGGLLNGPDEELAADEEIEESEVADLLDDATNNVQNVAPPANDDVNDVSGEGGEEDEGSEDGPEICDEFVDEEIEDPIPDLESEAAPEEVGEDEEDPPAENMRPTRVSRQPERYNLALGRSYAQIESCHNLVVQRLKDENVLEYAERETVVVANAIIYLQRKCFAQQFNLQKGLKEFGEEGVAASKAELR